MIVPQDFSIPYRAPGVVDILMPKKVGVEGYRVRGASNFDGTFVDLFTASVGGGFLDPAVDRGKLSDMPGLNHVRAVFNPDTYGPGESIDAGLIDTQQFWLQFQPVSGGVAGDVSAPVLVLSAAQRRGATHVAISGTAPLQASVDDSLALVLGRRMTGFSFVNNDGTSPLFVAFEEGGPEVEVAALSPRHTLYGGGGTSIIWVRGGGGAVSFSADFALP